MTDEVNNPYNARFWSKVSIGDGCWEWQVSCNESRGGYGQFNTKGRVEKAHRVAYREWYGEDADVCCHHCDNPKCVRPSHLYSGTHKTNNQDAHDRGRAYVPEALRGPDHPSWKGLDVDYVLDHPELSHAELGRKFGVSRQRIYQVRKYYARVI